MAQLLYLVVYNPTLGIRAGIDPADEDAVEQSHILFYTARERAVSRDRMLRQVGLAKALINFSQMFGSDVCDGVHSQAKRLVTVSPEPGFWIHAAVELSKRPRLASKPDKGKGKEKILLSPPQFDYSAGSVQDAVVRAELLRTYEDFKLLYGTFTSIVTSQGPETFERLLERNFTIWAWKWDFAGDVLTPYAGIPVHPCSSSCTDDIASFQSRHQLDDFDIIILHPPHVVRALTAPSSSSTPPSLIRYLLKLFRPPPTSLTPPIPARSAAGSLSRGDGKGKSLGTASYDLLVAPMAKMDVRKWTWPDALTFGKSATTLTSNPVSASSALPANGSQRATSGATADDGKPDVENVPDSDADKQIAESPRAENGTSSSQAQDPLRTQALPVVREIRLHLPTDDICETRKTTVICLSDDDLVLAFVPRTDSDPFEPEAGQRLSEGALELCGILRQKLSDSVGFGTNSLPKQPSSISTPSHMAMSAREECVTSSNAMRSSSSTRIFDAVRVLDGIPEVEEVISRGMNPQHWHIGHQLQAEGSTTRVFVDVPQKEATLSDVDNELTAVARVLGLRGYNSKPELLRDQTRIL